MAKNECRHGNPFQLSLPIRNRFWQGVWSLVRPVAEWAIGFSELRTRYDAARTEASVEGFLARALIELGVSWNANALDLARIPRSGTCIVVANHPFGAVEGIVLASMLRAIRRDVKVVANQLLWRLEPMRDVLLPVDPYAGPRAARMNSARLREALAHLKGGGMLAVFPAGEVAHLELGRGKISESAWNPAVAWLARRAAATVLPVHFAGRASALFQLAGLAHARLQTALLPRELLRQRGRRVEVRVGARIPSSKLEALVDDRERALYLRRRTLMLGAHAPERRRPAVSFATHAHAHEPIAPAIDPVLLVSELTRLPQKQCLLEDGERVVYWARAAQIPWILREIGRLREVTFRAAHEGTGKAIDLDAFDASYLHLFSFDRRDQAIVGAYRLGLTNELAAPKGLYTSTLFAMRPELFSAMGPAIEMGRSFVCARYQKSTAGLFLLWKGIGRFLAERPEYRTLFGPVSISAGYSQASRELMVDFITAADHVHPLSHYVRARHPFGRARRTSFESGLPTVFRKLLDVDEVSGMVADVEPDQKGIPVLFRQYLRLGGKMLGFNVDPHFSGALDGLVLVDLAHTEPKILARYLGADAARALREPSRVERAAS